QFSLQAAALKGARSAGNVSYLYRYEYLGEVWCGRGDLNPHAFRRHPLKMVCLPVSPLPHSRMQRALRLSKQKRRGKSSITKQKGRDEAVVEFSYCAGLTSTRKWLSARNLTSRCKA